jgi:hypothetical protein
VLRLLINLRVVRGVNTAGTGVNTPLTRPVLMLIWPCGNDVFLFFLALARISLAKPRTRVYKSSPFTYYYISAGGVISIHRLTSDPIIVQISDLSSPSNQQLNQETSHLPKSYWQLILETEIDRNRSRCQVHAKHSSSPNQAGRQFQSGGHSSC